MTDSLKEKLIRAKSNAVRGYKPVLALLLAVFLAAAFYQMWKVKDAYGVYEGKVISSQQFEHSRAAYEKSIKKSHENLQKELAAEGHAPLDGENHSHTTDENPLDTHDIEEYTRSQLVLALALENDADRYDESASQTEIDAAVLTDPIFYSSGKKGKATVKAIRNIYSSELGWTGEDLDMYYRTQILQEKLKDKLVESRNILSVTTRWKFGQTNRNVYQTRSIAERTLSTIVVPWLEDDSLNRADITARLEGYNNQPAVRNQAASKANYVYLPYLSKEDISNLIEESKFIISTENILDQIKSPRQFTEILESRDGYFSVLWTDGVTEGQYSSWDDYIETNKSKANFFGSGALDFSKVVYSLRNAFRLW